MRSPLLKRLPRELKSELGKYIAIFLFMTLTIGFISGFLVAGSSMKKTYDDSFEKYNIENGHFVLKNDLSDSDKKEIEKNYIKIYKNFYKELQSDKKLSGSENATLRLFKNRKDINKICIMDGELPKKNNEIALDRMFADNNKIKIGDTVGFSKEKYKVTGLVALSDYSALFSNNTDLMFDAVLFGVAIVTDNQFDAIDKNTFYDYAWKYNNEPANEKNEKKKSDKLVKEISKVVYAGGNEINEYVPRYTNSAINFTGDDIGSDHSMMIVLLYILIIILAFVFAVTINHTIVNEATAIGTLRAMGYSKKQLVVHYMALPIIISLIAAIIGNVLGYTIFKNVAAGMYYGSYSLTKYKTIWNAEAFILTTVVPLIIMLVINFITLISKLSISPLKFIRKDLTRKKNRRALKLPNFKFITRFRLRIILQNKGNYITLFVGILFANIMLLFGMMMHPLLTHYQNEIVDNMIAKNQYVLMNSVQVKNKDAEKYSLTSLQINRRSLSEDISLYGIEEDSKYFKKNVENGMYISDGLSEKYKINKGDTFTLKDKYSGKKYKIKVAGVVNYPGSLSVFMTRDKLNSLIDKDKNYFSGYFSNEKLSIDDKDVASVITEKDMTKTSRQLNVSMGNMFYLINVFAICLFVLLIYLLTKLIIEKNKNSISMVKILGYNNREVGKLYITATTWMVGLSIIISLVLSTEIIDQIYFEMMKDYNGWLTLYLEQKTYVEMFIIGIVCYGIVAFSQFKKIKKIPMDNALKNVE